MRKKMILILSTVLSLLLPSCQKATFDQGKRSPVSTGYKISTSYAWVHIEGNYQMIPTAEDGYFITNKMRRVCDFWVGDPSVAIKSSLVGFNIFYVSYVDFTGDAEYPFECRWHEIVVSELTTDSIYIFYGQNTKDGFNPYYYNFAWYDQTTPTDSKTSTSTSAN